MYLYRRGFILSFEREGQGQRQLGYYYSRDSPARQLNVAGPGDSLMLSQVSVYIFLLNSDLMSCRPSRLHLWLYVCGEDEHSTQH